MAKAKKAEVTAEVVPVLPEDTRIPALDLVPYVNEENAIELRGNYADIKARLITRLAEVRAMKVSAKDMETVAKIKKEARGYRQYFDGIETRGKSQFFNGPKDVFSSIIDDVRSVAVDIEGVADKVLDALEEKRVKEVTEILTMYRDTFQEKYGISEEHLALIEFKPRYYNKGAVEKEVKDDLESQFSTFAQKEAALSSGEKTIRRLCAANPLLNAERYISDLKEGTDLALVLDDIEAESARLDAVKSQEKARPVEVEEAEPVSPAAGNALAPVPAADSDTIKIGVIGVASEVLAGGTDFPGKTKKLVIEVEYPIDTGDALTAIFAKLAEYGIKSRVKEVVF